MPARLVNTTTGSAHAGATPIFTRSDSHKELSLISRFHVHLLGMYFAVVGREWSSGGKREGDYLHHIDVAFSGNRQVVWQDEVIDVPGGSVFFWPGNTPVVRRCQETCEVLYIKFRCEWLPGVDPLLDWPRRRPIQLTPGPLEDWIPWVDARRLVTASDLLWLHSRINIWLAEIIGDLDALIDRHLDSHARFAPVFQMIEENLGADLRVETLANACSLNRDTFARAFTRGTGISPKEFLNRRINQEALQWVINTDLTIKEISHRLRFSDEFHFSRFFLKLNGSPPSCYRRRYRNQGTSARQPLP